MDSIRAVVKNFIVKKLLSGEGAESLADDTELKDSGILDSLSTVELAMFLEEHFRIELDASDLDAANMLSIASIATLVAAKMEGR